MHKQTTNLFEVSIGSTELLFFSFFFFTVQSLYLFILQLIFYNLFTITIYNYNYNYINRYKTDIKGTVRLRPQIAKANCGGRRNTQSVINNQLITLTNKLQ